MVIFVTRYTFEYIHCFPHCKKSCLSLKETVVLKHPAHLTLGNNTMEEAYRCIGTIAIKCTAKDTTASFKNHTEEQCQEECKALPDTSCQATLYNRVTKECRTTHLTLVQYLDSCTMAGATKICKTMEPKCVRSF